MKTYIKALAITLTFGSLLITSNSFAQRHHSQNHNNNGQRHYNNSRHAHHNNSTNYYRNDTRYVKTTTTHSPGYTYTRNHHNTYNNSCTTTNRLRILPQGCVTVCHNNVNYYQNGSTYYSYNNGYYDIVRAPIGARVNHLPQNTYTVWQNGRNVYVANNTYYEAFVNRNGLVKYRVVGYSY